MTLIAIINARMHVGWCRNIYKVVKFINNSMDSESTKIPVCSGGDGVDHDTKQDLPRVAPWHGNMADRKKKKKKKLYLSMACTIT